MFFHDIFLHLFLFPRRVDSAIAGREETKNLAGDVLRQMATRLTTPSLQKITPACQDNSPQAWIAGFEFQKRGQLFIGTHDESFSVMMRVNNPDRSSLQIQRLRPGPSSIRRHGDLSAIISQIFHRRRFLLIFIIHVGYYFLTKTKFCPDNTAV
jgi:hypothetical protein